MSPASRPAREGERPWLLVTGAAKRLGAAVAAAAAARGWNIVLHHRSSPEEAWAVAALCEKAGARAAVRQADLAQPGAPSALMEEARAAAGGEITGLVNCAALFEWDDIARFSPDLLARHIGVNTAAPVALCQALAAQMPQAARGAIVNFLDFKLLAPYPDHLSYTLSKYALLGATEMLARALAPRIRVNAVAPGYVLPAPGQAEADYRRLHPKTPLSRGVEPEDVADAVCFLLGNPAITGHVLPVDAGLRFTPLERDLAFL